MSREIDALVAIEIFDWEIDALYGGKLVIPPEGHEARDNNWAAEWDEHGCPHWMPHFSTDIAAAWEVVEKMTKAPTVYFFGGRGFCCRCWINLNVDDLRLSFGRAGMPRGQNTRPSDRIVTEHLSTGEAKKEGYQRLIAENTHLKGGKEELMQGVLGIPSTALEATLSPYPLSLPSLLYTF